ncbi:PilZ domain-containing protein [Pseudothauera lacus]|nr:PilZ domain-containing protein [Pseudothauera lacus]
MDNRLFRRRSVAIDFNVYDDSNGELLGRMGDLSPAGFMVYSKHALKSETLYKLRVEYLGEDGSLKSARLKAKSMWAGRDVNPELHACGFRFFDLEAPTASKAVTELLARFTVGESDHEDY